jgi:hypothetical protein
MKTQTLAQCAQEVAVYLLQVAKGAETMLKTAVRYRRKMLTVTTNRVTNRDTDVITRVTNTVMVVVTDTLITMVITMNIVMVTNIINNVKK